MDTEDRQVQYDSDDITDPAYAKFTPTGSDGTANLPTKAGPGGNLRPGWFSNLFSFDLLDNKIEQGPERGSEVVRRHVLPVGREPGMV